MFVLPLYMRYCIVKVRVELAIARPMAAREVYRPRAQFGGRRPRSWRVSGPRARFDKVGAPMPVMIGGSNHVLLGACNVREQSSVGSSLSRRVFRRFSASTMVIS